MSVINKDIKKLEEDAKKLDAQSYFGLLACIVTGRSWQAITDGINVVKYTKNEVNAFLAWQHVKMVSIL